MTMTSSPEKTGAEDAALPRTPFLLQPFTWLRILWVAFRVSVALLMAHEVDPFFYQGF